MNARHNSPYDVDFVLFKPEPQQPRHQWPLKWKKEPSMEHFLMDLHLDQKSFNAANEEEYQPPTPEPEDEPVKWSIPEVMQDVDGRMRTIRLEKKTRWTK
jgi:hypothetical protein